MWALACAVTAALVAERIIFAWSTLAFYLLGQGPDRKSTWFVSTLFQNCTAAAGGLVASVARLFSFSVRSVLWCALVLLLWGVLYTIACYSSETLVRFQAAYNGEVGGAYRLLLVVPMQVAHGLWTGLVPLYNLACYIVKTVPVRVLIENVLLNWSDLESAAGNLTLFCGKLTVSLSKYVWILLAPPDSFDPDLRMLDLLTPLAYLRLCVSHLLVWLGHLCSTASSLMDLLLYPFLDINFGLGVHNAINAALALVVQVPATTFRRCEAGREAVYCLPDFQPPIDLTVASVRNFGALVDNWLDVAAIIVQSVLTNTSPACVAALGQASLFAKDEGGLFGRNQTVIVGVDDATVAKTDGWSVETRTRTATRRLPSAFPFAVNVELGVAVVSVTAGVQGLLGCVCTDQAYGLQLLCAVAPLDPLIPAYAVPVEFDVPTTSFYMGCGRSSVHLDSIRWPVTRYTSPGGHAAGRPSMAEAALYLRPACSSERIDVVCVETFRLANCFPYCMALWTKGYTGSMVLRGGDEWANTVAMTSRDCGLHTWDLQAGEMATLTQTLRQKSGVTSPWAGGAEVQLDSTRCVYAPNTLSRMLRNATPAYASHRSVGLPGQPFAFAGDLILTAVNTAGDAWGIDVRRVWGNQANEFTVVSVNKFIPALPPCRTPSDCTMAANSCGQGRCLVAVPYSFDGTPWAKTPAVATDRYMFWITNPSLAMYESFSKWCRQEAATTAFQAESSYSSIQVWRMDPYEFCPTNPISGVRHCPEDTSATFRTLPGFVSGNQNEDVCRQAFLVVAPRMTYVNADNIALTVLNTTFVNVDTATLRPIDPSLARWLLPERDVEGEGQHVAPVPDGEQDPRVHDERMPVVRQTRGRDARGRVERARRGDALGDEEDRVQRGVGRVQAAPRRAPEANPRRAERQPQAAHDQDDDHGLPQRRALGVHDGGCLRPVQHDAHHDREGEIEQKVEDVQPRVLPRTVVHRARPGAGRYLYHWACNDQMHMGL